MDDVIAFCLYLRKKVRLTLRRLLRRKCYRDSPERNECNQSLLHYSQLPEFILVFAFFLYFLNLNESYKTIPLIFTRNIKTNRQTDRQTESENVRCYPRWWHASLYDVIIMDELTINKQVASLFKKHLLLFCSKMLFFSYVCFVVVSVEPYMRKGEHCCHSAVAICWRYDGRFSLFWSSI